MYKVPSTRLCRRVKFYKPEFRTIELMAEAALISEAEKQYRKLETGRLQWIQRELEKVVQRSIKAKGGHVTVQHRSLLDGSIAGERPCTTFLEIAQELRFEHHEITLSNRKVEALNAFLAPDFSFAYDRYKERRDRNDPAEVFNEGWLTQFREEFLKSLKQILGDDFWMLRNGKKWIPEHVDEICSVSRFLNTKRGQGDPAPYEVKELFLLRFPGAKSRLRDIVETFCSQEGLHFPSVVRESGMTIAGLRGIFGWTAEQAEEVLDTALGLREQQLSFTDIVLPPIRNRTREKPEPPRHPFALPKQVAARKEVVDMVNDGIETGGVTASKKPFLEKKTRVALSAKGTVILGVNTDSPSIQSDQSQQQTSVPDMDR